MKGRAAYLIFCLVSCLLLVACQQQEPTTEAAGRVEANQAYRDNFGAAPQAKEGRAYARVAYLPLKTAARKLRAVPLFLFSEERQLQKIVAKMFSGTLSLPAASTLYNPFPAGLRLEQASLENGLLDIRVSAEQGWPAERLLTGMLAVTATASQFGEVERVWLLVNGQPVTPAPTRDFVFTPAQLLEVQPPALLLVAGHWEESAEQPDELLVYFDRPIRVHNFALSDAAGRQVAGDYFTSIFDMAVVVHPQAGSNYQPGQQLRVVWEVSDALGRTAGGEDTMPLQQRGH